MTIEEWLGKDNELGISIWHRKYQHNDESFDGWLDRVSGGNQEVRKLIKEKKFLFGGRILANRGLNKENKKITLSNCYVCSSPEDNLESIFEAGKKLARTYSYGGGVGLDMGLIAPSGAKVNNAAEQSSGAVSFMELYSMITGLISQSGRRGALMITMPVNHPDIEAFINCKNDLNRVTKANISVRVFDDFMEAVKNDTDYELSFTRDATGETISKSVKARELFKTIATNAWSTGEPGVAYWNRIENYTMLSEYPDFKFASLNPLA